MWRGRAAVAIVSVMILMCAGVRPATAQTYTVVTDAPDHRVTQLTYPNGPTHTLDETRTSNTATQQVVQVTYSIDATIRFTALISATVSGGETQVQVTGNSGVTAFSADLSSQAPTLAQLAFAYSVWTLGPISWDSTSETATPDPTGSLPQFDSQLAQSGDLQFAQLLNGFLAQMPEVSALDVFARIGVFGVLRSTGDRSRIHTDDAISDLNECEENACMRSHGCTVGHLVPGSDDATWTCEDCPNSPGSLSRFEYAAYYSLCVTEYLKKVIPGA